MTGDYYQMITIFVEIEIKKLTQLAIFYLIFVENTKVKKGIWCYHVKIVLSCEDCFPVMSVDS